MTQQKNKLWGGRFAAPTNEIVDAINASINYDQRMWSQDIQGSKAWAKALHRAGVLTDEEVTKISEGLDAIAEQIEAGAFSFSTALEDIHMNIEQALTHTIGDLGKKLHTGRSRNDQVCTDVRLYLRDEIDSLSDEIITLLELLVHGAKTHAADIIPGYTHLQRAQPLTLGYHLMTWATCIREDLERLIFARKMVNRSPLGSAALAGSAYSVDRHAIATDLGFEQTLPNGQMAVADRGFVMDVLHALSTLAVHYSRIGEEIVIWNSQEFERIALSDAWSTGSSIMPQKKNPDVAELLRGKAGRMLSAYQTLAIIQKGTPFAYNKDLQEDKEPVFDAMDNAHLSTIALTGMLADSSFLLPDAKNAAGQGHLLATELADYLVGKGIAFRDAHHAVGEAVALAEQRGCFLSELTLEQYQGIHKAFAQDLFEALSPLRAVQKRDVYGGTNPQRVEQAAEELTTFLRQIKQ